MPSSLLIVALPEREVDDARGRTSAHVHCHLDPGDERGAAFQRLHDAVMRGAARLALEVAVAEAIAALVAMSDAKVARSRAVRRAIEWMRESLHEQITLDELAVHAELDKFHLCRAFRDQVGMPPHAYLTRLRIVRAKELLAAGVRASEVAPQVSLYDQSQLNRHFRRIVGTTPARYARGQRDLA
jgi:AraC-like DNA-binding protein